MNASIEMPKYTCHKTVHALRISKVNLVDRLLLPEDALYGPFHVSEEYIQKHQPEAPGYYVVYKDGYKSWSPVEAFEEGYTLSE